MIDGEINAKAQRCRGAKFEAEGWSPLRLCVFASLR
jgi:hypothetical protein